MDKQPIGIGKGGSQVSIGHIILLVLVGFFTLVFGLLAIPFVLHIRRSRQHARLLQEEYLQARTQAPQAPARVVRVVGPSPLRKLGHLLYLHLARKTIREPMETRKVVVSRIREVTSIVPSLARPDRFEEEDLWNQDDEDGGDQVIEVDPEHERHTGPLPTTWQRATPATPVGVPTLPTGSIFSGESLSLKEIVKVNKRVAAIILHGFLVEAYQWYAANNYKISRDYFVAPKDGRMSQVEYDYLIGSANPESEKGPGIWRLAQLIGTIPNEKDPKRSLSLFAHETDEEAWKVFVSWFEEYCKKFEEDVSVRS